MRRAAGVVLVSFGAATAGLAWYLLHPLPDPPSPAALECTAFSPANGHFERAQLAPQHVFGMGLTYARHVRETAASFDPSAPPVFRKDPASLTASGGPVAIPGRRALLDKAESVEPGLARALDERFPQLPALVDYEAEIALVLRQDVPRSRLEAPGWMPALGFVVVNDLSARYLAILGARRSDRYAYWGASKSFPGFLPAGERVWVPADPSPAGAPCVTLTTRVNGEIRQQASTRQLIWTPGQMIRIVARTYPDVPLRRGDLILTGTPGGVALQVPVWKRRLGALLGLSRFTALETVIRQGRRSGRFLNPGDTVTVDAGPLGPVETRMTD